MQDVLHVYEAQAGGGFVDQDEAMVWSEESHCVDERGVVGLGEGQAVDQEEYGQAEEGVVVVVVVVVAEDGETHEAGDGENQEAGEEAEAEDHVWAVGDEG